MTEEAGPCNFACAGNCSCAIIEQLSVRVKESLLFKLFGSADVQSLTAGQLNDD